MSLSIELDENDEEKMVELIKMASEGICRMYDGELVYAFAGTNDKKLQAVLEKANFVKRGGTPEWPKDLDKKALYVLELAKETEVKGV